MFKKLFLCVAVVASTALAEGAEWQYAKIKDSVLHYDPKEVEQWNIEFPGVHWLVPYVNVVNGEIDDVNFVHRTEFVFRHPEQVQTPWVHRNNIANTPWYQENSVEMLERVLGVPIDQDQLRRLRGSTNEGLAVLGRAGFELFDVHLENARGDKSQQTVYWLKRRID